MMAEPATYKGSCHCGAVQYEVMTTLSPAIECNCSMCGRAGTVLTFVPAEQFELKQGRDNLQDYGFNKHVIHHLFCKTCGIKSFAEGQTPDGKKMISVNIRCLEGVDLAALPRQMFDGRAT